MPTPLMFGGFDLNQYAQIILERQPGPSLRTSTQGVPGRSGEVYLGSSNEPLVVIAHCTLKRAYVGDWDAVRKTLAATFCATERKTLVLPDEGGLARTASASFTSNVTEPATPPLEFDITFTDHDAVARGATRTSVVPSGGSVTISVDGTLPATLAIVATSAVRSPTSLVWGLRFDEGDVLRVDTGSEYARLVEIDCGRRTCRVARATSMITPTSVWPNLTPGVHTVRMDQGTGAATLTWQERWL